MTPWTIGLSTGCFYSRPLEDVLDHIHDHGFDTIEVCSFPAHLDYHNQTTIARAAERIRRLGMRPASFHAPFADRIDITALDETVRQAAVRELINASDAAAALGVETLVLHPGPEQTGRPPETEFIDRMRHAAESLNTVADHCCQRGVHLVLENMLPHLLFGHINDLMYLLGSIRNCDVGACLDTGHAHLSGELASVIHKLSGHLHMVHVNDNRGDRDDHLPPGEGDIDWPWILRELQRHRFSGILILELSSLPQESITEMLNRARQAQSYLVNLMLGMDGA
jgi:sugar phosphate isomerase/epimerase